MIRFLLILLTGIAGSLFFFPINLPFAPAVNTKMVLAVLGAAFLIYDKTRRRTPVVSRSFFILCLLCLCLSLWAFFTATVQNSRDYSYATYIISVIVWLGAAYAFVRMIRSTHGRLDIQLIGHYLVGVCIAQCAIAYSMTFLPWLRVFVNNMLGNSVSFLNSVQGRLYGLGAALDPAGLRFAGVLVIMAFLIHQNDFGEKPMRGVIYLLAFVIISVIGNMIARSTTIGMLLALVYLLFVPFFTKKEGGYGSFWAVFFLLLLGSTLLTVWLYQSFPVFRANLRFGFEGFFSLVEKGRWEVHSNDVLKGMVVWPESLKTWIIGDGYFASPTDMPDQFGQVYQGFYMKTDIGYLRFIFYFGVIGLLGMISVFVQMTVTCIKRLEGNTALFIGLLLVTLIGWFKVSSDIIMIIAPFLILAYLQEGLDSESGDPTHEPVS